MTRLWSDSVLVPWYDLLSWITFLIFFCEIMKSIWFLMGFLLFWPDFLSMKLGNWFDCVQVTLCFILWSKNVLVAISEFLARNWPNLSPFELRLPFPNWPTFSGKRLCLPVSNWAFESIPIRTKFLFGIKLREFWSSV